MRDPTRGGLASALNELAEKSDVGFIINENKIPINPSVAAACEFLGLDPLYVANEGKLIAVVAPLWRPQIFLRLCEVTHSVTKQKLLARP